MEYMIYGMNVLKVMRYMHSDASVCLPDDSPVDTWEPVENYPCVDPLIENFTPQGRPFTVSVFNKAHSYSEAKQFCEDKGRYTKYGKHLY